MLFKLSSLLMSLALLQVFNGTYFIAYPKRVLRAAGGYS